MPNVALLTFDSIIKGPDVSFTFGANPNAPPNSGSICPAFETMMNSSAGASG